MNNATFFRNLNVFELNFLCFKLEPHKPNVLEMCDNLCKFIFIRQMFASPTGLSDQIIWIVQFHTNSKDRLSWKDKSVILQCTNCKKSNLTTAQSEPILHPQPIARRKLVPRPHLEKQTSRAPNDKRRGGGMQQKK